MPIFPIRWILMLALPAAIAAAVLAAVSQRGRAVFKKQGVAWGLTALMVFAAIGIGYAKTPLNGPTPEPAPRPSSAPATFESFVRDDANVLSAQTERELTRRNERLWDRYSVTVAVITCNYGRDDLGDYAYRRAMEMGLGGYDMIVALDISGDNYWLVQGNDLRRAFTDDDCSDYAYEYMEGWFVQGDYDNAVLDLTEALEDWYGSYYR